MTMPGALEIVKGRVGWKHNAAFSYRDVPGLQDALERFVGKRVNITVEEDTSEDKDADH